MSRQIPKIRWVAVGLFLLTPLRGLADEEPVCGRVYSSACCASLFPADSSCLCRLQGPTCKCSTATGGVQNGTIIQCAINTWNYTPDPPAKFIEPHEEALCKTIKGCVTEGLSSTCGQGLTATAERSAPGAFSANPVR